MAVPSTYRMLIERIKRHMNNGFPNDSVTYTDNEVMLYIQSALATGLIGQVYGAAKVTGNIEVPEGYITTYQLPALAQDTVTKEWYSTLPQTPISLPLGYSIDNLYFADAMNGRGKQVYLIIQKDVSLLEDLPKMFGIYGWVEATKILFKASDGSSLLGLVAYCRMACTRITDLDATMILPDDAIENIFNKVVALLIQRIGQNKDIISDGLPAGNKQS